MRNVRKVKKKDVLFSRKFLFFAYIRVAFQVTPENEWLSLECCFFGIVVILTLLSVNHRSENLPLETTPEKIRPGKYASAAISFFAGIAVFLYVLAKWAIFFGVGDFTTSWVKGS